MSQPSSPRRPSPEPAAGAAAPDATKPLPLDGWARDLARRWNSGSYSLFVLHGNIFDVYPLQDAERVRYVPLKTFLAKRLFPHRRYILFYDVAEGLSFADREMQAGFFRWLAIFDEVEGSDYHQRGPPAEFNRLVPLLQRFFQHAAEEAGDRHGVTLVVDFAEKIIPAQEEAGASVDERKALVSLLKWAASREVGNLDVGVLLVTESASEVHSDLVRNPHVSLVTMELPSQEERGRFLEAGGVDDMADKTFWAEACDFTPPDLAKRTSGLNLLRVQHLLAEARRNGARVTADYVASGKKRLIEEYCQGLVRFKDPKPGVSLDRVATHKAAKARLRELAWLIRNGKFDVVERGVLLPGRVGVGKSFMVDCFASECGLPVMELGEFRSKWVGDTEMQQMRILMTIRALGPVVVVVDEADAVFGTREVSGDSGVSSRVFAAFAAHLGDSSLRGRELWVAMTSRPDLLAIDMKRQGRFGLCVPLFPAQDADDVMELFTIVARVKGVPLSDAVQSRIREAVGARQLTGSDVEAILMRAKERAVLAGRDQDVRVEDLAEAVDSFIDPLDPLMLELQELAAVLACSDRRYLPPAYANADRAELMSRFGELRLRTARR